MSWSEVNFRLERDPYRGQRGDSRRPWELHPMLLRDTEQLGHANP
jgi:hypothetical protein